MIDCIMRTVAFREPSQKVFRYRGCQCILFSITISSSRARQMISRGCASFLACIVKGPTAASKLADIPIVHKFPDIFFSELTSMLSDREIEFMIDVVLELHQSQRRPTSSTSGVARVNVTTTDLLTKGFICPSVPPWEVPVLCKI